MADDSYVPEFDTPAGLPGFGLNDQAAVPGAYAHPLTGGPVTDTVEMRANTASGTATLGRAFTASEMANDSISASMPGQQESQFGADTTNLANDWQTSVNNLSGLSAFVPASVPATPGAPGEPDNTSAPNPATLGMAYTPPTETGTPNVPTQDVGNYYPSSTMPAPVPDYSSSQGLPSPAAPAYPSGGEPASSPLAPPGVAAPMASTGQPGDPGAAGMASPGGGDTGGGAPGGAGALSASVPNANDSLTAAVASAAASAGPQAALVAGDVTLSMGQAAPAQPGQPINPNIPGTVSVGTDAPVGSKGVAARIMALGSNSGSAPQFAGDSHGWFFDAVNSWMAANPPAPMQPPPPQQQATPGTPAMPGEAPTAPAPPPDAMPGGSAPSPDMIPGQGMASPAQDSTSPMYSGPYVPTEAPAATTNQTVGSAVMNQVDSGLSRFSPGYQANMQAELPTDQQSAWDRLANGSNDMWSSPLGGIESVGSSEAQGIDDNIWKSPLGGIGPDPEADAKDDIDPVTGTPNYDPSDIWSSPLGGISNVQTSAEEGQLMPPTVSWSNRMMTL